MKSWAFAVAAAMLLSAWGSLQVVSRGEPIVSKRPFSEFPLVIHDHWKGKELGIQQDILNVLKVSDYMMRVYVPSPSADMPQLGMRQLPVYLYVGYYQSQRNDVTYHSPKNCLPGAGWEFVGGGHTTIEAPGGKKITINKVMIQKGLDKQVMLYWYQDRGRVIASEYWAKVYLIWDAMTRNRTDGALVRISLPVAGSAEDAYQEGLAFLQDLWPFLDEYLPGANLTG